MNLDNHFLVEDAKALLKNASSDFSIKALLENQNHYNLIWVRNSHAISLYDKTHLLNNYT